MPAADVAGRWPFKRLAVRLTHPGIPRHTNWANSRTAPRCLVMKLVRGRTLADLLAERPAVSHDLPRSVAVFEQVCQAGGHAPRSQRPGDRAQSQG